MPIVPGWETIDNHHLKRIFHFPNFVQALHFVNLVGAVAETAQHHPNIDFTWGKVEITTFTHDVNGLTEKDYSLAAEINKLSKGDA